MYQQLAPTTRFRVSIAEIIADILGGGEAIPIYPTVKRFRHSYFSGHVVPGVERIYVDVVHFCIKYLLMPYESL